MIIDFHTHVGPVVDKTADDLLKSMDKAKIDKSVIISGAPMGLSNNDLVKLVRAHSDRFYGIIYGSLEEISNNFIHEDGEPVEPRDCFLGEFLDNIQSDNILGVKFFCGYEYFYPNEKQLGWYFSYLTQLNRLAMFHTGDTYTVLNNAKVKYTNPIHIDDVAVEYPDLKIVIAHMGNPYITDCAQVLYKNKNVYADMSGYVYGSFNRQQAGKFYKTMEDLSFFLGEEELKNKLLFGTDWPISDQQSYVEVCSQAFEREFLRMDSRELLLSSNKSVKTLVDSILKK